MKRLAIALTALALMSPRLASSQTIKVGTTAGQFLKIGVGARAVAMGEAFVATANDVSTIYWNPGGLAQLEGNQAMFMHSRWLADITFNHAALAIPLGDAGTVGAFVTSLNVPEDEVRTVFSPEGTGERFGASDLALGVSYGRFLTDRFSFGFTAKFIQQRIWSMTGNAFALDVGTTYKSQFRNLRIGMAMSNFGSKIGMQGRAALSFIDIEPGIDGNNEQIKTHLEIESWDLPLLFRVGAAFEPIESENSRLTVAVEAAHPNDNREYINAGFEYGVHDLAFVRAGYRALGMDEAEGGLTLGGGLALDVPGAALSLDYAWVDYGRLDVTQRFVIGVQF